MALRLLYLVLTIFLRTTIAIRLPTLAEGNALECATPILKFDGGSSKILPDLESAPFTVKLDGLNFAVTVEYPTEQWAAANKLWGPHYFDPGSTESAEALIIAKVLDNTKRATTRKPLFIDGGMNGGFFTQFAHTLGAQVLAFDIQPMCVSIGRQLAQRSSFSKDDVIILEAGLGDRIADVDILHQAGCDAGAHVTPSSASPSFVIHTLPLDEVLPVDCLKAAGAQIDFLKLDTEGLEPRILQGASGLLREGLIRNLVVEVAPMFWGRHGISKMEGAQVLNELIQKYGFKAYNLFRYDPRNEEERGSTALPAELHPLDLHAAQAYGQLRKVTNLTKYILTEHSGSNIWFTLDV